MSWVLLTVLSTVVEGNDIGLGHRVVFSRIVVVRAWYERRGFQYSTFIQITFLSCLLSAPIILSLTDANLNYCVLKNCT